MRHTITPSKIVNGRIPDSSGAYTVLSARDRDLSRDQLRDRARGTEVFVTDRAIDVHITAVRKKLADLSWMIHTVRGVGYRLLERKEEESVA